MTPKNLPSDVTIQPAVPEDAATICAIRDEAWLGAYPNKKLGITTEQIKINAQGLRGEFIPRRIAYLQKEITAEDGKNRVTFVARKDGQLVGFIAPRRDERGRSTISMLYVLPDYQGQGIGRQLMQTALEWFGLDHDIFLEVVSYNQNAIRFYEKFGFTPTNAAVPEETDRPAYITPLPQTEMVLRLS